MNFTIQSAYFTQEQVPPIPAKQKHDIKFTIKSLLYLLKSCNVLLNSGLQLNPALLISDAQ